MTRIAELSWQIQQHVHAIDAALTARGEQSPSWNLDTPPAVGVGSEEIQESQIALLETVEELVALVLGPVPWLLNKATDEALAFLTTHFLLRNNILTSFPPGSKRSFASLASEGRISESDLGRFLHFSILDRVFEIDSNDPQFITHTPASKALHDSPGLRACIGQLCEELWPAASRTVDAMEKWTQRNGGSYKRSVTDDHNDEAAASTEDEEPSHTGWSLANGTDEAFYNFLSHHERRGKQFADSMSFFHAQPGFEYGILAREFDWGSKVGHDGMVVDIGGNQGEVSFAVARLHPEIRFVVQDLESAIISREKYGSKDGLRDSALNVQFMVHDFFTEQPVKDADVYLLRWILHNWPDAYAVNIIRNLIPALKRGARILVVDRVMLEPGISRRYTERQARKVDLTMKAMLNAKERTTSDWTALFRRANSNLRVLNIVEPPLSVLSIIEVMWEGEGHDESPREQARK